MVWLRHEKSSRLLPLVDYHVDYMPCFDRHASIDSMHPQVDPPFIQERTKNWANKQTGSQNAKKITF